jgi:uncharacterized protein YrrD
MRVDLGSSVYTTDGTHVGDVQRLVLNPESNAVEQLIVHHGHLHRDSRLVPLDSVQRAGTDGVFLRLSSSAYQQLPHFVETQFVVATFESPGEYPHDYAETSPGTLLFSAQPTGRSYQGVGSAGYPGVTPPLPLVTNESSIGENMVVLDAGTDVFSADGERLGEIEDVLLDAAGHITAFVVRHGFVGRRELRVPIAWVASSSQQRVTLNVNADIAMPEPV